MKGTQPENVVGLSLWDACERVLVGNGVDMPTDRPCLVRLQPKAGRIFVHVRADDGSWTTLAELVDPEWPDGTRDVFEGFLWDALFASDRAAWPLIGRVMAAGAVLELTLAPATQVVTAQIRATAGVVELGRLQPAPESVH